MTKKSKSIFGLLFAFIMVFQLGAPIASAAPVEETDYALVADFSAELTPEQIKAIMPDSNAEENEIMGFDGLHELEAFKDFSIKLGETELVGNAEGVNFKAFLEGEDEILVTVPAGYYVSELEIQSESYEGKPNSLLPAVTADGSSANLRFSPAVLLDAEGNADDEYINVDGADYESFYIYAVLELIDDDEDIDIDIEDQNGEDLELAEGNALPAVPEGFDAWQLTYEENGTSVILPAGTAIAPYDDCDIIPYKAPEVTPPTPDVPPVTEKYTISAAVKEGMKVETDLPLPTDFYNLTNVPEGITVDGSFTYTLKDAEGNEIGTKASAEGTYTVVLKAENVKVLKDGAELTSEQYEFVLTDGTVEYYSISYPLPVTVKAQAPVADGDSFKANGYITPVEGLRDGDKLVDTGFSFEVKYEGEGADRKAYVVITGDAKFTDGSDKEISFEKYAVTFAESDRVAAPAAEKPQITDVTVTAKAPVYDSKKNTFVLPAAPVYDSVEGLKDGDKLGEVTAEVKKDSDGKFYTSISAAEILDKDGSKIDAAAKYNLKFVDSGKVQSSKPEAVEVTVTAKAPVYNKESKKFELADPYYSFSGTEGKDTVDPKSVKYEIVEEADGAYLKISSVKIVNGKGKEVESGKYNITYVNSEKTPLPKEAVKIVITAKDPVLGADKKSWNPDGYTVSGLVDGDTVKDNSLKFEVKFTADKKGVYVSVSGGEIVNGKDAVAEDKYTVEYKDSAVVPVEEAKPETDVRGEITIKPKDAEFQYDAKEHKADNTKATITSGKLLSGDSIVKLEVSGSRTDAGTTETEITKLVIKDSEGKDVTDKYDITYGKGELKITKKDVTFTAITANVTRKDGDTQTIYASKLQLSDGRFKGGYEAEGLIEGHKVSKITVNGSGSKPGSSFTSSVDAKSIEILEGNKDVTANYNIKTVDGTVSLKGGSKPTEKGIPLTVSAKDGTWTYDGKEHSILEYEVSGLKDGDKIGKVSFKNSSKITNAGTAENVIESVSIVDKNGNSVDSGKYSITLKKGTLTVNKYNITVTAESASKKYDGKALENNNVSIGKLASKDHKVSVSYAVYTSKDKLLNNPPIEAGTYTKKITKVTITDAKGNDVTDNYNIKKVDGTLTIKSSDKNDSESPKTGDESNIGLWITLLGISAAVVIAVVVIIILKNKKKSQEDEIQDIPPDETEENGEFNIDLDEFKDNNDSDDKE